MNEWQILNEFCDKRTKTKEIKNIRKEMNSMSWGIWFENYIWDPNCNELILSKDKTYRDHYTLLEYHWRYEYPKYIIYKCTTKEYSCNLGYQMHKPIIRKVMINIETE